jgi:hypothetical protein
MQVLSRVVSKFPKPGAAGRAALALAALLAASGCQNDPDEKAPQCPTALFPPDAATITRYDGKGTDLTNLVLSGRMLDVKGACKGQIGHKVLKARAHVEMQLTRGPAFTGRDIDVRYNVAVVKNGQPLEKQALVQHVTFPPNVDSVQVTGQEVKFTFPTDRGLNGPSYTIYFLFELTPEELQANQAALRNK